MSKVLIRWIVILVLVVIPVAGVAIWKWKRSPKGPQPVSILNGQYGAVLAHGDIVFAADGQRLNVIDITNHSDLQPSASLDQGTCITSLAMVKGFLALGLSRNKIQMMDISTPASPKVVQTSGTLAQPLSLKVDGDYLYIQQPQGVEILQAAADGQLMRVGTLPVTGSVKGIDIHDGQGCVVTSGSNESSTASFYHLSSVGSLKPHSAIPVDSNVNGVSLSKDLAVFSIPGQGVEIYQTTDPAQPISLGRVDDQELTGTAILSGKHLFVPSQEPALTIYDLSDPKAPKKAGSRKGSGGRYVSVDNDKALLLAETLEVLNVAKPSAPRLLCSFTPPALIPQQILARENLVFVADSVGQFSAYDLSTPTKPVRLGAVPLDAPAITLSASGSLVIAACGKGGIAIIDTLIPMKMKVLNRSWNVGEIFNVLSSRGYVYLISKEGINGYSLTHNYQMKKEFLYPCRNFEKDGVIVGNYAYLLSEHFGLQIIDQSLPFSPSFVGLKNTSGGICLAVDGDQLYVSFHDNTLQRYSLSDPMLLNPPTLYEVYLLRIKIKDGLLYGAIPDRINVYDLNSGTKPDVVNVYFYHSNAGIGLTEKCLIAADNGDGVKVFEIAKRSGK